jgi:hypothetical protein
LWRGGARLWLCGMVSSTGGARGGGHNWWNIGAVGIASCGHRVYKGIAQWAYSPNQALGVSEMEHRDPEQAFDHAIEVGLLTTSPDCPDYAGNYMYMYTADGLDYFKHIDTREYIRIVSQS